MHTRRELVAALYWLDRMPFCRLRFELEALVLAELAELARQHAHGVQGASPSSRSSARVAWRNQNDDTRGGSTRRSVHAGSS